MSLDSKFPLGHRYSSGAFKACKNPFHERVERSGDSQRRVYSCDKRRGLDLGGRHPLELV